MKKNLFLGFIALATVTITGCLKDEVVEAVPQQKAIEFGTYIGRDVQTRSSVLNTDGLHEKGFGVFASYTTEDWNATQSTPNFMFNQLVSYTNTAWTYSPVKYWPENGGKISFFAYGPYYNYAETPSATVTPKVGNENASANTVPGAPIVSFTQATDVSKMVDFVAAVAMNKTYSEDNTSVNFEMKHELTRLNFSAKLAEEYYSTGENTANATRINIKSVKIVHSDSDAFYASADYTFASNDNETGKWSSHTTASSDLDLESNLNKIAPTNIGTGNTSYTTPGVLVSSSTESVGLFKPCVTASDDASESQDAQYVFLIPPVNNSGDEYTTGISENSKVYVSITYDIITMDDALANGYSVTEDTKKVSLPVSIGEEDSATPTLQQGKAYNFTFAIGLNEIKVSATVADWDTSSSPTSQIN